MHDLTLLVFGFGAGYLACLGVGVWLRAYKDSDKPYPEDRNE